MFRSERGIVTDTTEHRPCVSVGLLSWEKSVLSNFVFFLHILAMNLLFKKLDWNRPAFFWGGRVCQEIDSIDCVSEEEASTPLPSSYTQHVSGV